MQSQLNTSANDKTSIAHTVITLQLLRNPPPPRNVHKCLNTNSIPIYGCCDTDLYCHVGLCNTKDVWLPTNCTSVQYWSCHSNKINKCFSFFPAKKPALQHFNELSLLPCKHPTLSRPCFHSSTIRHFHLTSSHHAITSTCCEIIAWWLRQEQPPVRPDLVHLSMYVALHT